VMSRLARARTGFAAIAASRSQPGDRAQSFPHRSCGGSRRGRCGRGHSRRAGSVGTGSTHPVDP
jgi:hypothetical protein